MPQAINLTDKEKMDLLGQVNQEYFHCTDYMDPWWSKKDLQLKIYNNQDKDAMVVSDNLMYTTINTAMASLYDDQPLLKWEKRSIEDEQISENLTDLVKYDYDLMQMDMVRYRWIWDTLFFGRGLVFMMEWDRKNMIPVPENLNPMTTLRDPRSTSVNGDHRGAGSCRFLGWEVVMTEFEMKKSKVYDAETVENLNNDPLPNNSGLTFKERREDRDQDTGHKRQIEEESITGPNRRIPVLRWFTNFNGKKVMVEIGNGLTEIIRYKELKTDYWPVFDRTLSPQSDTFDGVSIPDLVEDKQRANARLINSVLRSVETSVDPRYVYNKQVIRNKRQLVEWKYNKYISADGPVTAALAPVPKDLPRVDVVNWMRDTLQNIAETATATPELKTGQVGTESKTATELALVNQKVDDRFSLIVKVFSWGERDFWREWYRMYKRNMSETVDEKMAVIEGAQGDTVKAMKKKDIISRTIDPDVKIESSILSESRRINELQALTNLKINLQGTPGINTRYLDKQLSEKSGMSIQEVNRLFPKNEDERMAEVENEKLVKGKYPGDAKAGEDHDMHLEKHSAMDNNNKNVKRHIATHRAQIVLETENPQLAKQPKLGVQDQERLLMNEAKTDQAIPQLQDQTFQSA